MNFDKYIEKTFDDIREHLFEFRDDAIVEVGLKDHPKGFRVFHMAWHLNDGPARMLTLNPEVFGTLSDINEIYKGLLCHVLATMKDLASLILED